MGSDLSKPKNKKHNHKSDCADSTANGQKRNSRTICYDLPECYDPCSNAIKYPPIQLPPLPRQTPRYPRDPCRDMGFDPYDYYNDRSTIVSNLQLSPRTSTRKLICYECPEKNHSSSRSPRYKTVKPALKREDTFLDDIDYKEERSRKDSDRRDRRYTVVNSNNQQYYSDNKNGKLTEDFDGIPKDRIYEIRKEKILIKADKSPERERNNSERYRSKSSEKYLDNNNSKYDDGNGTYKVYERDDTNNNNGIRKQLQSRSVYVLRDDREPSPERQSYPEHKYINKNSSSTTNGANNQTLNAPAISTVGNSDIVYVPMVKEDFIKRECKKLENINTELKY